MNSVEKFRESMRRAGIEYHGPITQDGELHRFKAAGDDEEDGWYVLFPDSPIAGAFGHWRLQITEKWSERSQEDCTPEERALLQENWKRSKLLRERTEAERHKDAKKTATELLAQAETPSDHPYLKKKGVRALGGVRIRAAGWPNLTGACLVLPLQDSDCELHSLQFIDTTGDKRFLGGGRISACFFALSDKQDGPLVICEGFATGASIHEATDFAVVCAMNCGNLLAVAQALRAKYPNRKLIVAADNDAYTTDQSGKPTNPGLEKATNAARTIEAWLAIPGFKDSSAKPTDFNDLAQSEGLEAVRTLIDAATKWKPTTTPQSQVINTTFAENHPVARRLSDLASPLREDSDELLGRRYLCRGGGTLLVGPTGIWYRSSRSAQVLNHPSRERRRRPG
jgi:putative DNA primase/helicase